MVEIDFPVEFLVRGRPLSLQTKSHDARTAWRKRIRLASRSALPEDFVTTEATLAVTLFYFPDQPMQGDVDNIVKPVLDALGKHVYYDDRQVERVWVQKFEPGHIFQFGTPSQALSEAIVGEKPLLYVCLSDDVTEGLS